MLSDRLPPLWVELAAVATGTAAAREAVALRSGAQTIRHGELQAQAGALAAHLWHRHGVRAGDRIAWLGFSHPQQIVLLLALARLGAMLVPLNFRLAPAEWRAVLADCRPRALVHDAAWAEAAGALADALTLWPLGTLDSPPATDAPAPLHAGDAPALLVYTSGTTGAPKGAVHWQSHLAANARIARAVQGITPADRILTVLPLFHVGGLCIQTLPALTAGAEVILHPRFEADAVFDALERQRPTLTLFVPAVMKALVEHPRWAQADLSCLRAVWAGSSVIPQVLIDAFHARGVPLCNVYGATETGPFSIALGPAQALTHAGSCGWPAPQVEVRLVKPAGGTGEVASERVQGSVDDGVGELLIRAPNVVRHYWPDRPATDAEGWFHSGDLARQDDDGSWRIVGRARDMIISGGENIYPAEIEQVLAAHPGVADCAVVGMDDAQWGEVVVAVVVPRGSPGSEAGRAADGADALDVVDARALEAALRDYLQPRIARYKQPRRWMFTGQLPRTALGKVRKDALRQQIAKVAG